MKRLLAILLSIMLIAVSPAFASDIPSPGGSTKIVLLDQDGIQVYINGLPELVVLDYLQIPVIIVNNSEYNITVTADKSSVNGWAVAGGFSNGQVPKGKKAKAALMLNAADADLRTLDELEEFETYLSVYNTDNMSGGKITDDSGPITILAGQFSPASGSPDPVQADDTEANPATGDPATVESLLNSFMGTDSASPYASTGGTFFSSIPDESINNGYSHAAAGVNTAFLNPGVAAGARYKYSNAANAKNVTVLVYLCGADSESQSGMATADVQEMIKAGVGDNANLLVYTGGCSRWKNNMFSNACNQIYRIMGNGIECLVENAGNGSMTDPSTLQSFIEYGYKNFKADRMCLILWGHGGGSVSGYGYDEKAGRGQSMTLAGINTALDGSFRTLKIREKDKFDFIGFDAGLMATVENGLMLSNYADYMIASEETEPGVGWYYTNWLKKLSDKPNMATIEVGKNIADDFVEVCAQQCRGQAATLSVVDLAELGTLFPAELDEFSKQIAGMIQSRQYRTVAAARSRSKEFAQSSGIDQIDLYDFAVKLGTPEGYELKAMIESAVKYNRTGGGISNAHGLSIYFPYKNSGNVRKAVSTYQDIGMVKEYTRCIQAFAGLEAGGQANGEDEAADYVNENHIDDSAISWEGNTITLPDNQLELITAITENLLIHTEGGYWDMGLDDKDYYFSGNTMTAEFDGAWFAFADGQNVMNVPYYNLYATDNGCRIGYVPALLTDAYHTDTPVKLIICTDEDGLCSIVGAQVTYQDKEDSGTEAKTEIGIINGARLQFICDFYDEQLNYDGSYIIGSIEIDDRTDLGYAFLPAGSDCRILWMLEDIYHHPHRTPAVACTVE